MSRKRVYEIAREQGVTSRRALTVLGEAGFAVTTSASAVEEDRALAALADVRPAAPDAPEQKVRAYLKSQNGDVEVPAQHLLTSWHLDGLDADGAERVQRSLARAGVAVEPPLAGDIAPDAQVTLRLVPARPSQPQASVAPKAGQAGASRPRTEAMRAAGAGVRRAAAKAEASSLPITDRLRMRMRLKKARADHDAELRRLGGVVFEMYRAGAQSKEVLDERLERLFASSAELSDLEKRLGESSDDVCPSCGLYCGDADFCLACGEDIRAATEARSASQKMSKPMAGFALVLLTGAWFFGGFRGGDEPPPPRRETAAPAAAVPKPLPYRNLVAQVRPKRIAVYNSPRAAKPKRRLANPDEDGAPLVFLVKSVRPDGWAQVYLPVRPNGSTGWIRTSQVDFSGHSYRIVIRLGSHRLIVYDGKRQILRTKIGIGQAVYPTPTGLYYVTKLLKQPNPDGLYGPWAFGLSAYSPVLTSFNGGNGILGIHGTNQPELLGQDVSHGCIRTTNSFITRLTRRLPVGTPVRITRS